MPEVNAVTDSQIERYIDGKSSQLIELLKTMTRIPSPTFHEQELALFVCQTFDTIGMHAVTNEIGDAIGTYSIAPSSPIFLLNTHLDHADPGDMQSPYSGDILDGSCLGDHGQVIVGRGTNGQKASLAAMIMAAEAVLSSRIQLKHGFGIHAGILEECGGHLSPRHLLATHNVPIHSVLCGEHTNLQVVNRQRGMIRMHLEVGGIGGHSASLGGTSSALTGVARIILSLEELNRRLPEDPVLGRNSATLNELYVVPNIANAVPHLCHATIDIRHSSCVDRHAIVGLVQQTVQQAISTQAGVGYAARIEQQPVKSYTGYEDASDGSMFPFHTPADNSLVSAVLQALFEVTGKETEPELWTISSEAGYFSSVGNLPTVAFGPGEDRFTHNNSEHVRLEDVVIAAKVYARTIIRMCS